MSGTYNCHDNIFKISSSSNVHSSITSKYSLFKTITPGVSGSRVYLVKHRGKSYFCKITRLRDTLTKSANLQKSLFQVFPEYRDVLIGCQLSQFKCFPKIYQWGLTDHLDPWNQIGDDRGDQKYIFIILEYLGATNLKSLLIKRMKGNRRINYSLTDFRKNMRQILDCYIMANRTIGFIHDDFKPDNIMITNDKRAVMIDFGLSYTTKYKKRTNLRVLATRLTYSLLPFSKKRYIEFDKYFTNKSLYVSSKISSNYNDLEKIIRTINLGERLFSRGGDSDSGVKLDFSDEDYKYFNSKAPFHRKLQLIKKRYIDII